MNNCAKLNIFRIVKKDKTERQNREMKQKSETERQNRKT